jgi:hypothetical protein
MSADVIATALVASYRFGGKDPRDLLGPNPSVTLLADAALVIKERLGLGTTEAAGLCCLSRPRLAVRTKMSLHFGCDKRDRRQAAIKAALAGIASPAKPEPSSTPISPIAETQTLRVGMLARQLAAAGWPKAPQDGLGTSAPAVALVVHPTVKRLVDEGPARGCRQPASLPVLDADGLPPIPPVVCGMKWTREYIAEREHIKGLHRKAGRKVPS